MKSLFFILSLLFASCAFGQETVLQEDPSLVELAGRILVYLVILAFMAWGLVYFLRRGNLGRLMLKKEGKALKQLTVCETHVLGNKQFLVVVAYKEKRLLLGVGPGMIRKLAVLEDEEVQGRGP